MSNTQPARGMRDFLPDDVRRREHVVGVIRDVYRAYGFEPLETPAIENIDTLLGKYGDEGNKLIFKILRRGEHESTGEADLALRYDLTVPLARVVAQYQGALPKFFKRYQVQPVWRADRPARGRFREFYQCDIDTIGSTSPVVEADQITAVCEVMTRLGFTNFVVRLNHRRALTAMLLGASIPVSSHADALVALDKLDKIGREGVEREFAERGIEASAASACLDFLQTTSKMDLVDALGSTLRRLGDDEAGRAAISQLIEITDLVEHTPGAGRIVFDPSLARGLSYYTGAIMEIAVPDLAGSLGGGGRYDNLIGMFLGREVPACGFSLGLERILVVMAERNMFPAAVARGAVDVMVTIWNDEAARDALRLAGELRAGGLRVDVYPDADKIGKQFKYAGGRGVPFVAVVGDDERARAEVAIKDLRSGEQASVPRADATTYIKSKLNG